MLARAEQVCLAHAVKATARKMSRDHHFDAKARIENDDVYGVVGRQSIEFADPFLGDYTRVEDPGESVGVLEYDVEREVEIAGILTPNHACKIA